MWSFSAFRIRVELLLFAANAIVRLLRRGARSDRLTAWIRTGPRQRTYEKRRCTFSWLGGCFTVRKSRSRESQRKLSVACLSTCCSIISARGAYHLFLVPIGLTRGAPSIVKGWIHTLLCLLWERRSAASTKILPSHAYQRALVPADVLPFPRAMKAHRVKASVLVTSSRPAAVSTGLGDL